MTLEVDALQVSYGRMLAVRDVSLVARPGELTAIIGANGAGKSTTLKAISGLVRPQAGRISLSGKPLIGMAPHAIARLGVGHVPEGRGLLAGITVAENLRLGALYAQGRSRYDRDAVLSLFPPLRKRLPQPAAVLSGGEQQMLSIARTLLLSPQVLLIDEMSLGLAPKLVQQILEVVVQIARSGIAVLCVEQSTKLILKNADQAYVIENGRTTISGTGAELGQSEQIVKAYLGSGVI